MEDITWKPEAGQKCKSLPRSDERKEQIVRKAAQMGQGFVKLSGSSATAKVEKRRAHSKTVCSNAQSPEALIWSEHK